MGIRDSWKERGRFEDEGPEADQGTQWQEIRAGSRDLGEDCLCDNCGDIWREHQEKVYRGIMATAEVKALTTQAFHRRKEEEAIAVKAEAEGYMEYLKRCYTH